MIDSLYNEVGSCNPFVVADFYSVDLEYVNFYDNPLGLYIKILGQPTILISNKIKNTPSEYFVLAHELHHALEHKDISSFYLISEKTQGKLEHEANRFATLLCYEHYNEMNGEYPDNLHDLELAFGVPYRFGEMYLKES